MLAHSNCFVLSIPVLVLLVVRCSAKILLETIPTFPELSQLQSYIEKLPRLSAELDRVDNYTLLAPTNDAFDTWLSAASPQPTLEDIEATLYYHLLHGIYPITSFSSLTQFVPSFLTNSSYSNVTAGQTVQLALENKRLPLIRSGNGTNTSISTSDVVATGGLIQIVSSVLQIPEREPIVVRDAKLTFFIGLLTKAGFLSTDRDELTTKLTNLPDTTYFAPNTEKALAQFSTINVTSADQLSALLKYHVVSGKILYSTDWADGMNLTTLQGTNLTISVGSDGSKFVNGARILERDFLVANGVLHTIDNLLDPQNITTPFQSTSSHRLSKLVVVALIISVLATISTLCGIGFWMLRRQNFRFPSLKRRPAISYPIYSGRHHELGSSEIAQAGVWTDSRNREADKLDGLRVKAVELDTANTRGQVWELQGREKIYERERMS
ncbi:FAS1 domain-containing protein [Cadophora sp. MPI-SDFR-AT-0126]|nr:FAS1 domain-containing protein [Leotiomycetes sp. MPI-SDFR-AT-0126]